MGKLFGWLFSKKIKVQQEELERFHCVKHKKSNHKLKLNTNLIVPENCKCVFCYGTRPCEVFSTGTYKLNGNSLPELYKRGNFNKPNKKNVLPDYFVAGIWFASENNKWIEFEIKNFKIKDRLYGKQKLIFCLKVNFAIDNYIRFFQEILHDYPRITSGKIMQVIAKWFENDIRKYLKRQGYMIDDLLCYTKGYNAELQDLLVKRFTGMGLKILETSLDDIIMKPELVREITDNRNLSFNIHSTLKDYEIAMNNDGVKSPVTFERSAEQMQGSIVEKYTTPTQDDNMQMDDDYFTYNQQNNFNQFNQMGQLNNQISQFGISSDAPSQIASNDFSNNCTAVQELNDFISNAQKSSLEETKNEGCTIQEMDYNDMYDMANSEMGEQNISVINAQNSQNTKDAFNELYGSSALKICDHCKRQVSPYASCCPYCGCTTLRHNL